MTSSPKKNAKTAVAAEQTPRLDATEAAQRVYVVDDDPTVRDGLEMMLTQEGYDVRTFQSSAQFAEEAPLLLPGVVVTEQVIKQIVRVLLVSALPTTNLADAAMKRGAVTVLDKQVPGTELIDAVREAFFQLRADENHAHSPSPQLSGKASSLDRLSRREREVIDLLNLRVTNKAIATQLRISVKTVEKHRATAMRKLQVTSLASLVRLMERELDRR